MSKGTEVGTNRPGRGPGKGTRTVPAQGNDGEGWDKSGRPGPFDHCHLPVTEMEDWRFPEPTVC